MTKNTIPAYQGLASLQDWFETPTGRYLAALEQEKFDQAVADIFGYHALQLGLPSLDLLAANRMPHRWRASSLGDGTAASAQHAVLLTDYAALPFPENSLDLVVLSHALDSHPDPRATLREVSRVLVPGGRIVLSGFNPASLWGMRMRRERLCRRFGLGRSLMPAGLDLIGNWRLRDWLHLLDFEIETSGYGAFVPAVGSQKWLRRFSWLDRAGARCWPIFGSVYFLVAVKRVHGMRLMEPAWKNNARPATASVPLVRRQTPTNTNIKNGNSD